MKKLLIAAALVLTSTHTLAICEGVDMKKLHKDLETVIGDGEIGNEIVLYNKMMTAQEKACLSALKTKKPLSHDESKIVELYNMLGENEMGKVKMPSHF